MQNLPILVMGFTSVLLQITALRKMLSVFAGNELVIGITLAVWLTAAAAGSFVARHWTRRAFALTFAVTGLLAQPAILLIDRIPGFLSMAPGETMSLGATLSASFLCLFPLGLALGSQFPASVSYCQGNAAKAYGLEAAGAFAGGLIFTVIVSGRMSSFAVASALGIVNLLIAVVLFKKKLLMLLLAFPLVTYFGADLSSPFAGQGMQRVQKIESRYGEIAVFKDRGQMSVFCAGAFQYSYPDRQTEEMKVHLPLSLHGSPSAVLVIGGSAAVLREMLKYPLSRVDFVEIDPAMIGISLSLLSGEDRKATTDPRIRILTDDARKFVKSFRQARYDLVLLNLPEPSTASINRFYTVEFFTEVKAAMKHGGILCLSLPASHGYIGRRMQFANGSVYASLKTVFPEVAVSSEEYGGMYASDGAIEIRPRELAERFTARRIRTTYFYPLIFTDIFDPLKIMRVKTRLDKAPAVNSDKQPVAYLYNLMAWSEVHGGRLLNFVPELSRARIVLLIVIVLLAAVALFWKKKEAVAYAVFTGGYSSMALSIVILLTFQARYGYVYESIGFIMAMFMAGLAAGALLKTGVVRQVPLLRAIEAVTMLALAAAPLFFTREPLYYVLVLLAGIIGGMQFSAATRFGDGNGIPSAALYAVDLSGSVAGALLTAVLFVPLLGIANALYMLIALKGSSLVLLSGLRSNEAAAIPGEVTDDCGNKA